VQLDSWCPVQFGDQQYGHSWSRVYSIM